MNQRHHWLPQGQTEGQFYPTTDTTRLGLPPVVTVWILSSLGDWLKVDADVRFGGGKLTVKVAGPPPTPTTSYLVAVA